MSQFLEKGAAAEVQKRNELDRRMQRGTRLRVNQGEAEGVYDCTRPRMSPQICPQDCPRGATAGRFLWASCVFLQEDFPVVFANKSKLCYFIQYDIFQKSFESMIKEMCFYELLW